MTMYAKVNQFSKYAPQATDVPFPVYLVDQTQSEYCWSGNSNMYRTSDLDFYFKQGDGQFRSHGIMRDTFDLMLRLAETSKQTVSKGLTSSDFSIRYNLYCLNREPSIIALRELLEIIPQSEPRCPRCSRVFAQCRCDD